MPIDYNVTYGVARVTLNRPEKRNALNLELIRELQQALDRAAADESARVILLRGAGPDFCSGLDLTDMDAEWTAMDRLAAAPPAHGPFLFLQSHHRAPMWAGP